MNDQEKAREELAQRMRDVNTPDVWGLSRLVPMHAYLDAVLAADPRVIAEANDWEVRTERRCSRYNTDHDSAECTPVMRTVIVLPPRKVESGG